jgi:hypothetical protein
MVPPGWFRLATSPTRDWVARDHEEGDELAPSQIDRSAFDPRRTSAGLYRIGSLDDRDFAEKYTVFQIDERSKFQTQKGPIFGLV